MKKSCFIFLTCFMVSKCKKEVQTADLLGALEFSSKNIIADGTTRVTITTTLNGDADPAFRNVLFTCSKGSFVGGTDSTVTVAAAFENEKLVAHAHFVAPLVAGDIGVKAKIVIPNEKHDYIQTGTIAAAESVPDTIILSSNAFAVKVDYGSEATITGLLLNQDKNKVSLNNLVKFRDHYEDQTPVHGRFRETNLKSNAASTVSTIYSPGTVDINKKIWVVCVVVDSQGNELPIKDSVLINTISN